MKKVCTHWVPMDLMPKKKKERNAQNCQELLALHKDQEGLFGRLVNVDGSWFHYQTSVAKRQSMRWKHDDSPCPKKFQTAPFAGKQRTSVIRDMKGILLIK